MDTINEAKTRANDVINGFRNPSEALARDVLRLAAIIEGLEKRLAAQAFKQAGSADILKDIFGMK